MQQDVQGACCNLRACTPRSNHFHNLSNCTHIHTDHCASDHEILLAAPTSPVWAKPSNIFHIVWATQQTSAFCVGKTIKRLAYRRENLCYATE